MDSYLSALLGAGLSTEHFKAAAEAKEVAQDDADASIAAKYYVNQILNLDEESITQAWMKVRAGWQRQAGRVGQRESGPEGGGRGGEGRRQVPGCRPRVHPVFGARTLQQQQHKPARAAVCSTQQPVDRLHTARHHPGA